MNFHSILMFVPDAHDLLVEGLGKVVSILVGENDAFEGCWVCDKVNLLLTISYHVIESMKSSRLFVLNDDVSDLEEEVINRGVVIVEFGSSVDGTRALVSLNHDQKFTDQVSAFGHEELFVEVDSEVFIVPNDLKVEDLAFLVSVDPLSHHISSLSVSLTPLFGLCIVELETNNSSTNVLQVVDPKEHFFLAIFEAK